METRFALSKPQPSLPISEAHEQHIIKTAQRLEELNSWVSQGQSLGNVFQLKCGINLTNLSYVKVSLPTLLIQLMTLTTRTQVYCHTSKIMTLQLRNRYLYFRRC